MKYTSQEKRLGNNTEVVDLADEPPPVEPENGTPRQYRKLQDLHSKVQNDRPGTILKSKPSFSYASDTPPDLSFLLEADPSGYFPKPTNTTFTEEMPSITTLIDGNDPFADEEFEDSLILPSFEQSPLDSGIVPSPKVEVDVRGFQCQLEPNPLNLMSESTFAKTVFDFDQFRDIEQHSVDTVLSDVTAKRTLYPGPEKESNVKRQCLVRELEGIAEDATSESLSMTDDTERPASKPAWLTEIDKGLLDYLGDTVTYI